MKSQVTFVAIVFSIILLFTFVASAFADTIVERNGNNFTATKTITSSQDTQTVYTYTIKDTVYPIFITKNGRCYIIRTSKKGNEYKQYLNKDICLEICKELNVEYKE